MPSTTFLNLPAEKRAKLLSAAIREFSQRPFNEASINQIIKDAGISRGSFYMYFRDKEELFCYLLRQHLDTVVQILQQLLVQTRGDIFAALLRLYDYIRDEEHPQTRGDIGALQAILYRNRGMQKSSVLGMLNPEEFLDRLASSVDRTQLNLKPGEEPAEMLGVLLSVTMPILYSGLQQEKNDRDRLKHILDILRRGMGRPCSAALTANTEGD